MDKFLITDRFDPFALGDAFAWRFRALTHAQAVEAVTSQYARPQDANEIDAHLTPAGFALMENLRAFPFGLKPKQPVRLNLNRYDSILIVGYMHAPEQEGGGLTGFRFVLMQRADAVTMNDEEALDFTRRAVKGYAAQVAPRTDFEDEGGYDRESHRVHLDGARADIERVDEEALARAFRIAFNLRGKPRRPK